MTRDDCPHGRVCEGFYLCLCADEDERNETQIDLGGGMVVPLSELLDDNE